MEPAVQATCVPILPTPSDLSTLDDLTPGTVLLASTASIFNSEGHLCLVEGWGIDLFDQSRARHWGDWSILLAASNDGSLNLELWRGPPESLFQQTGSSLKVLDFDSYACR